MSRAARDLIFTRYLYLRSDVAIALLSCILNKKTEKAQFWLMELYYSGYFKETVTVLWRTYYEFYATLNPTFEAYFIKKMHEVSSPNDEKMFLLNMLKNLTIRPHNCDVFILREITANLTIEGDDDSPTPTPTPTSSLLPLFKDNAYEDIARHVMDGDEKQVYSVAIDFFIEKEIIKSSKNKKDSLLKDYIKLADLVELNPKIIVLTRIMQCYSTLHKDKLKMGKNLYLSVKPEDALRFDTVEISPEISSPEKILEKVVGNHSPNEDNYLFLFYGTKTKEEQDNLKKAYLKDWLYYASYSPVWKERIYEYGGYIQEEERKIVFEEEDNEEEFFNKYGYNPDEHVEDIQDNNVPSLKERMRWTDFYEKHKNMGLYIPDKDMLEVLDESTCEI